MATDACGSLNLCVGLKAGIWGAVHAVQSLWEEHVTEDLSNDSPIEFQSTFATELDHDLESQPSSQGEAATMNEDSDAVSEYDPNDDSRGASTIASDEGGGSDLWGGGVMDTENGFNNLNRKAMMWTVRHEWAEGSRMAFNFYRHSAILVMHGKNGYVAYELSKEGVMHGCPLPMLLYGVALTPLAWSLRDAVPGAAQPWYANDRAIGGQGSSIAKTVKLLM
jgi:hypothetical protein